MLIERGGAKSLLWCALVSNKQTRVSKKLFFRFKVDKRANVDFVPKESKTHSKCRP